MNARVLCALHFAHNHIPAIFNSFTLFYTDLPTAAKAQSSTKGNADGNESFARTFFWQQQKNIYNYSCHIYITFQQKIRIKILFSIRHR